MLNNPYRLINIIFAAILLCIFLYAAAFNPDKSKHPVPSYYKVLTGEEANSSGLSRAFSSIIRFQFAEARAYNPFSIQIFIYFLSQFFLRIIFVSANHTIEKIGVQKFVIVDSILSTTTFVLFFEPFWKDLVQF